MANHETEAVLKTLVGRTDIEDALQQLDTLTKEEALMTATRNLEVTHQVKVLAHDVQDKMKVTKEGARCFLAFTILIPTIFFLPHAKQRWTS